MATEPTQKPIHSIIIDTGPLIQNAVSISTIVASAEVLYTTPAIISEIRDEATRSRVDTTLKPFLNIKSPSPASYEAVAAFAKKTGDFTLLSRQDLGIFALAYEVHCEKHGGPRGLRNVPNGPLLKSPAQEEEEKKRAEQKRQRKKGMKLEKKEEEQEATESTHEGEQASASKEQWVHVGGRSGGKKGNKAKHSATQRTVPKHQQPERAIDQDQKPTEQQTVDQEPDGDEKFISQPETSEESVNNASKSPAESEPLPQDTQVSFESSMGVPESDPLTKPVEEGFSALQVSKSTQQPTPPTSDDDSDGDWITPDNLTEHQAQDGITQPLTQQQTQTPVATMTTDFAMQNVLLQMNLNLLSTNMQRIRKLRTSILRCHACFLTTKQMDKQFCPRCGQPTLTRVSCSTNAAGEFRIHLSKKYQHNTRGNRYSIPKPVAGTSNGKLTGKGGGKGGWGRELVLAEDQKEFVRQSDEGRRAKTRDLMDEDYLPGILTGDRQKSGGRPKVGAGRNINSRKRF